MEDIGFAQDTVVEVHEQLIKGWQSVVDIMAKLLGVPAGLIMRIDHEEIEVLVASQTEGNPYHPGDREHLPGSGLYCERVINTRSRLHVPNALKDREWSRNPDIKLNMISYLGFPITLPGGGVFGTLCVLSERESYHSALHEELMTKLQGFIERDLALHQQNVALDNANSELQRSLNEIKTLRGIIPICASCKQIRDDDGFWKQVEVYMKEHSEAEFSHSVCPKCADKLYGDEEWYRCMRERDEAFKTEPVRDAPC